MNHPWANDAIFYHIYPLGLVGAPRHNDFQSDPVPRLEGLYPWLDHIQKLGANAIYLGPVFESSSHGYDTADYYKVDRRLGAWETLRSLSKEIHRRGMRLVLDGVFHHVGRHFWAFKDLQANRQDSAYASWFSHLDFNRRSPHGDPFHYEGWSGHYDLVKLDLSEPAVRQHLFDAVRAWVEDFEIDGLRLDAADQIAPDFLKTLASHCRTLRSDFWLVGEMVQGDYRRLAQPQLLDSATNYEAYKGLYSSHVDCNYYEIAYSLKRQFGPEGIYNGLTLYSFADNHDVNRVASSLRNPAHLYSLYCLLFAMPGIPSIYYGSEWGIHGTRTTGSDAALRPALSLPPTILTSHADLPDFIALLARIRLQHPALRLGSYQELHVAHEQLAFLRACPEEKVVVAVNAAAAPIQVELHLPLREGWLVDLLNPGNRFRILENRASIDPIPPSWGRLMTMHPGQSQIPPG
jgi:glycosidase